MSRLWGERQYPQAPFQKHSATSKAAAEAILPKLNALQRQVYAFIRNSPGVTDEQIIDGLRLSPSTARPRRIELVAMGLVEDSGTTARTKADRPATVWRVTEKDRG